MPRMDAARSGRALRTRVQGPIETTPSHCCLTGPSRSRLGGPVGSGRCRRSGPGPSAVETQDSDNPESTTDQEPPDGTTKLVKNAESRRRIRFEMKTHPSVRIGKWFRADFRLKFQHDFRTFDPEVSTDEGELSNLRKFRVGISGYVTKDIEYEVEREIRNEVADLFNLRTRETQALCVMSTAITAISGERRSAWASSRSVRHGSTALFDERRVRQPVLDREFPVPRPRRGRHAARKGVRDGSPIRPVFFSTTDGKRIPRIMNAAASAPSPDALWCRHLPFSKAPSSSNR